MSTGSDRRCGFRDRLHATLLQISHKFRVPSNVYSKDPVFPGTHGKCTPASGVEGGVAGWLDGPSLPDLE